MIDSIDARQEIERERERKNGEPVKTTETWMELEGEEREIERKKDRSPPHYSCKGCDSDF